MWITLISYICRGQTFSMLNKVFTTFGLKMLSKTLFYQYHAAYVNPAINTLYQRSIADALTTVKNQEGTF